MSSSLDYLKNWFDITKYIITRPRDFFREMPLSGSFREPFEYMIVTALIAAFLTIPMILIIMADGMRISLKDVILTSIGVIVFLIITIGISLPMNALVYHLLLKISGAKGKLETTVRVYCYYMATGMIVLPAFGIMMMLSYIVDKNGIKGYVSDIIPFVFLLLTVLTIYFTFYVLTIGFSEAHRISMKRVFLGVFGIPLALTMILIAIPMLFVFSNGFSTEVSDKYTNTEAAESVGTDIEPTNETITAFYGSSPAIDGSLTAEDGWDQADSIEYNSDGIEYTLAAKRDVDNIYILIKWEGEPTWQNSMGICLEQDGNSHDHDLSTGRDDYKYNGDEVNGPDNLVDTYHEESIAEAQNGMVAGNYADGYWVQEWAIPIQNGGPGDISVHEVPTTLGFAVVGWDSKTTGSWPEGALPDEPRTWGNLKILHFMTRK